MKRAVVLKFGILFTFLLFVLTFGSCRKGDNDPFLSLKTRKQRLTGEYNIVSWDYAITQNTTDLSGVQVVTNTTGTMTDNSGFEDVVYTTDGVESYSSNSGVLLRNSELIIKKDGDWSSLISYIKYFPDEDGNFNKSVPHDSITILESGTWSFLTGKTDDFKRKERVMLGVNSKSKITSSLEYFESPYDGTLYINEDKVDSSWSYLDGNYSHIYEIDRLTENEIILEQDYSGGATHDFITLSSNYTRSGYLRITLETR